MNKSNAMLPKIIFLTLLPFFVLSQNKDSLEMGKYMIPIRDNAIKGSYNIDITTNKTTHIIFPSKVVYMDVGNASVIVDKADNIENIIRVKATDIFTEETTLTVIDDTGGYYSFLVNFKLNPAKLSINIASNREADLNYAEKNGLLKTMEALEEKDLSEVQFQANKVYEKRAYIKHLSMHRYKVNFWVNGIYYKNDLLYLSLSIENNSFIPYEVNFIKMYVKDREKVRRTSYQELEVKKLYQTSSETIKVAEKQKVKSVFVIPKLTITPDKIFYIECIEKAGGRHLNIELTADDFNLVRAL
jgi:conjugative transposon TraN protein